MVETEARPYPTVRAAGEVVTEPNVTVARSRRGCGRQQGRKGLVAMSTTGGMTDPNSTTIQSRYARSRLAAHPQMKPIETGTRTNARNGSANTNTNHLGSLTVSQATITTATATIASTNMPRTTRPPRQTARTNAKRAPLLGSRSVSPGRSHPNCALGRLNHRRAERPASRNLGHRVVTMRDAHARRNGGLAQRGRLSPRQVSNRPRTLSPGRRTCRPGCRRSSAPRRPIRTCTSPGCCRARWPRSNCHSPR